MVLAASEPLIHSSLLRRCSGEPMRLLNCLAQGSPVVRIAVDSQGADNPIAKAGCHEHYFAAKLVALVDFAFGDALYLWRVRTVELIGITPLLLFNLFCSLQQRGHLSIWLR